MGLRFIPPEVLKLKTLLRLRLDFNDKLDIAAGVGIPPELMRLKLLSLRACNIRQLPHNVYFVVLNMNCSSSYIRFTN